MPNRPTLYMSPGSHHSRRVRLLVHELGIDDVDEKIVDVRPPGMGGETESPTFRALNPNGKVPVLEDGDRVIFESNAIMAYLAERHGDQDLWPADRGERAQVHQWQLWQAAHLSPVADGLLGQQMVLPMMGQSPDPARVDELNASFHQLAGVLDGILGASPFIAHGRLTCADLSVATALMYAAPARIPLADHPPLAKWLERMQARSSWAATEPPPMPG